LIGGKSKVIGGGGNIKVIGAKINAKIILGYNLNYLLLGF